MLDLEKTAKELTRRNLGTFNRGRRTERKEVLEELKRIHGFPEMGCREQLKDFIDELERRE